MATVYPPANSWRPIIACTVAGLPVALSPFAYDLPLLDQLHFSIGLFLTYGSIGLLIALLPRIGPRWAFGAAIGLLYSLPGSILVAVPYPLRTDAHEYYRNFAAGGAEEFVMTMVYGMAVGVVSGIAMPRGSAGEDNRSQPE